MSGDFTLDQKRYLEGFAAGLGAARPRRAEARPSGPDAAHIEAQDRAAAGGAKLCDAGKMEARGASIRRLPAPCRAGPRQRGAQAGG